MNATRQTLLLLIVSALAFGDEVPDGEIRKKYQVSEPNEVELDKKSIDSIGSSFIKRPIDAIGSNFIKKGIDSIGSSFIKRPVDSIGSSFIKRGIDSIGSSFIKRPVDSIGSSFIKKGIDSIGSSFIKRPIDSIGSSFIKKGISDQSEQEINQVFSPFQDSSEWAEENPEAMNFIDPRFTTSDVNEEFNHESDDESKRGIDSIGSSFIKRNSDGEYESDDYMFTKENESMRRKRSVPPFESVDKVPVNYILNRLYENNKDTRSDLTYGDIMSLLGELDAGDSSLA